MRILIKFSPVGKEIPISFFQNKFRLQGMFYNFFLRSEKLRNYHEKKGFKFFCFSDVFKKEGYYFILFSSPSKELIEELEKVLNKIEYFYIASELFKKEEVKILNLKVKRRVEWETGSPIVVYHEGKPFSFYKDRDYRKFFDRLKENALKKYLAFNGEEVEIKEIFDYAIFRKSVSIPLEKGGKKFVLFGSCWKKMVKLKISRSEKKFYQFLMDCGIGEKNSLGFGFVNPKR